MPGYVIWEIQVRCFFWRSDCRGGWHWFQWNVLKLTWIIEVNRKHGKLGQDKYAFNLFGGLKKHQAKVISGRDLDNAVLFGFKYSKWKQKDFWRRSERFLITVSSQGQHNIKSTVALAAEEEHKAESRFSMPARYSGLQAERLNVVQGKTLWLTHFRGSWVFI